MGRLSTTECTYLPTYLSHVASILSYDGKHLHHVLSAGISAATALSWTQIRKSLYLRCDIHV